MIDSSNEGINKTNLKEALNFLVQSDLYNKLINEITEIIETWETHPMRYEGQLILLNSLIEVGLHNRELFERLVGLIERKRQLMPSVRRVDYQRELMRERRARLAKALELHERSGQAIKNAAERVRLEKEIQSRWNLARKKFVASKGQLSWKARNAAVAEFWATVDAKLDANLKARNLEIT